MGGGTGTPDTEYDAIFYSIWEDIKARCQQQLDPDDYDQARGITDVRRFREGLLGLQLETRDAASRQVLALLHPILDHYESFAGAFVAMMGGKIDVSIMWGLLYLLLKLSLSTEGSVGRISTMLRDIGFKIHLLQGYIAFLPMSASTKSDALEVNKEIVILWLSIICMFRDPVNSFLLGEEVAWITFHTFVQKAEQNIDKAITRAQEAHALKTANDSKAHTNELEHLRALLSYESNHRARKAKSCRLHSIPFPQNPKFFGREEYLLQIESVLQPSDKTYPFSSLVLHGLAGVGKTQVALQYAYDQSKKVDVVMWIPSENEDSLCYNFSRVATKVLNLSSEQAGTHTENRVLLLDWFRQTNSTWLVVFDNAESTEAILQYWPVSTNGAALVTTRNPTVARHLAQESVEVKPFQPKDGAQFFLSLLKPGTRHHSSELSDEVACATELSCLLGGHALALNQMAAFALSRGKTVLEFLSLYRKSPERLHHQRRPGSAAYGYELSIGTLWAVPFKTLNRNGSSLLGVISMVAPEKIPVRLFQPRDGALPPELYFCADEFSLDDTIESLLELSLAERESDTGCFHTHRLVQAGFLEQCSIKDRQQHFENAIDLLTKELSIINSSLLSYLDTFPDYVQHMIRLVEVFKIHEQLAQPLKPSLAFCSLVGRFCWGLNEKFQQALIEDMISVSFRAFEMGAFESTDKSKLIYAYLENLAGSFSHSRSRFSEAIAHYEVALRIRKEVGSEPGRVCHSYTNLCLSMAAGGNSAMALELVEKGLEFCTKHFENKAYWLDTRLGLLWAQTSVLAWIGDRSAVDVLNEAFKVADLEKAPDSSKLKTHITAARVYYQLKMMPDAWSHLRTSLELMESRTSATYAEEKVKLQFLEGCLWLDNSQPERAIPLLLQACATMELSGSAVGLRALMIYRTSGALREAGGRDEEVAQWERRALRDLRTIQGRPLDGTPAGLEEYQNQITVGWRL